jgi:hypothetical protein
MQKTYDLLRKWMNEPESSCPAQQEQITGGPKE